MAQEYATVWMPEYGREYWEEHHVDRRLTLEQLVEIAEGHLDREEELLTRANRYLFTDTNAITTYIFSLNYHGFATDKLAEMAVRAASRCDLVFVCDTDIPYNATWDQSGDGNRSMFQKHIVADLQFRKIPYLVLRDDLETPVRAVEAVLARPYKNRNLVDTLSRIAEQMPCGGNEVRTHRTTGIEIL